MCFIFSVCTKYGVFTKNQPSAKSPYAKSPYVKKWAEKSTALEKADDNHDEIMFPETVDVSNFVSVETIEETVASFSEAALETVEVETDLHISLQPQIPQYPVREYLKPGIQTQFLEKFKLVAKVERREIGHANR